MTDSPEGGAGDVWFTVDRSRYFRIPEGAPLRAGSLRLRSLKGQARAVDASVVGAFEVSKEEATELLGAQIEGVYESAREALLKLASWAGQEGVAAASMPTRLEDFIGLPTGAIITEPDTVKERVQAAMGRVKTQGAEPGAPEADDEPVEDDFTDELLGGVEASEPASERAPEEATEPDEAPGAEGPAFHEAEEILKGAVKEAGEALRSVLRSPEVTSALESIGDRLRRLAQELREESDAARDRDNVVEFPGARRPDPDDEPEA